MKNGPTTPCRGKERKKLIKIYLAGQMPKCNWCSKAEECKLKVIAENNKIKHFCTDCCWCYCDSDWGHSCLCDYECNPYETDCESFCEECNLSVLEEYGKKLQKDKESKNGK